LIAGGIGLAPLRPVIKTIQKNRRSYGSFEILYGARTPSDQVFTDEFEEWRRTARTRISLTVDSAPPGVAWPHKTGVVTGLFEDMETSPENSIVMTCGPATVNLKVLDPSVAKEVKPLKVLTMFE
jgi:NAD(P)H-flavin reductase